MKITDIEVGKEYWFHWLYAGVERGRALAVDPQTDYVVFPYEGRYVRINAYGIVGPVDTSLDPQPPKRIGLVGWLKRLFVGDVE